MREVKEERKESKKYICTYISRPAFGGRGRSSNLTIDYYVTQSIQLIQLNLN